MSTVQHSFYKPHRPTNNMWGLICHCISHPHLRESIYREWIRCSSLPCKTPVASNRTTAPPTQPSAATSQHPSLTRSNNLDSSDRRIPRIIHQVWFDVGHGSQIGESYREHHDCVQIMCKRHGYVHVLWNEVMALQLLQYAYADFVPYFMSYRKHIYRIDAIRYFILHAMGGIYLDMDVRLYGEPSKDDTAVPSTVPLQFDSQQRALLDHMIRAPRQCVLYRHSLFKHLMNNCVMACVPGHGFFEQCIRGLYETHACKWHAEDTVIGTMKVAGPWFLARMLNTYLHHVCEHHYRIDTVANKTTNPRESYNAQQQELPIYTKELKQPCTIYRCRGTLAILPAGTFSSRYPHEYDPAEDCVYGDHTCAKSWMKGGAFVKDVIRVGWWYVVIIVLICIGILWVLWTRSSHSRSRLQCQQGTLQSNGC